MTRMIEYMRPDLSLILTHPDRREFLGIPCVGVEPDYWQRSLVYRVCARARDRMGGGWQRHVRRVLRRAQLTHILLNYVTAAMQSRPAWDALDVPVLVHCHGFDVTEDGRFEDNPAQPLHDAGYAGRVRDLAGRVTFIANSEWTRQRLLALRVPDTAIEVKRFGVAIGDVNAARRSDDAEVTIVFLGRLVDFKGPEQVIRAFCMACDRGLKGRLLIAGDGPMRVTCELMRIESPYADRIAMLGEVDRATAGSLLRDADVFTTHHQRGLISRREEAFGVAVVEAMGWGLPVVCGRSGGVPETVEHGVNGILITPGDIDAHAEAFLRLADSAALRHELGTAAQRRVRESFTIAAERARMYAILKRVQREKP